MNTIQKPTPILPSSNETEIWLDLPNRDEFELFIGKYQVSSFGRVRSMDREVPTKAFNRSSEMHGVVGADEYTKKLKGKVLRLGRRGVLSRQEYAFVCFATPNAANGKYKQFSVHRLVAFAFEVDGYDFYLSDPKKYNTVDHSDWNTMNNYYKNLRFLSHGEQKLHSHAMKNNTTGFKGVTVDKRTGKYIWSFNLNHKSYSGKSYSTAIEAAMAKDTVLLKLEDDGEIRPNIIVLNFPREVVRANKDKQLTFDLNENKEQVSNIQ